MPYQIKKARIPKIVISSPDYSKICERNHKINTILIATALYPKCPKISKLIV